MIEGENKSELSQYEDLAPGMLSGIDTHAGREAANIAYILSTLPPKDIHIGNKNFARAQKKGTETFRLTSVMGDNIREKTTKMIEQIMDADLTQRLVITALLLEELTSERKLGKSMLHILKRLGVKEDQMEEVGEIFYGALLERDGRKNPLLPRLKEAIERRKEERGGDDSQ